MEDASCPNLAEDLPRLRGNYLGMLRLIDDQTKRLVEGFKAAGLYENTIFVILSDHGDYCGEYENLQKSVARDFASMVVSSREAWAFFLSSSTLTSRIL